MSMQYPHMYWSQVHQSHVACSNSNLHDMSKRLLSPIRASGSRASARLKQKRGNVSVRTSKYFQAAETVKTVKTEPVHAHVQEITLTPVNSQPTDLKVEKIDTQIGSGGTNEASVTIKTEIQEIIGVKTEIDEFIGDEQEQAGSNQSERVIPVAKLSENFSFSRKQPNVFEMADIEDVTPSQPKNWLLIYNQVVRMRAQIFTPVDNMGCEKMADTINPGISQNEPRLFRFQILVSLMLSAQTKDEVNYKAIVRLQNHLQTKGFDKLCIEGILSCSETEIDSCIAQVGFHRRKAVYLKKASEKLQKEFGSDIPKTISEITSLPGVGPKMGYLLLQIAWGINEGIGVDVHLHRLAVQWGWVPKSDKPEITRLALQEWLPKRYWADINPILVGFGQAVCTPQAKNCDICSLSAGLCKAVDRKMVKQEMTPQRRQKLLKSRGDLSELLSAV